MLIDTHCHFDFAAFSERREQLWADCQAAAIGHLIVPGVTPAQWPQALALTQIDPGIHYSVGLHPWWINAFAAEPAQLANALHVWLAGAGFSPEAQRGENSYCYVSAAMAINTPIAIGECGLDGSIAVPMTLQLDFLRVQLRAAVEHRLPVILHAHRAQNELLRELKQCPLPAGGVLHGFSGSVQQAMAFWQCGIYLGIGGTITYPRAVKTRAAVTQLPLESLVLETDSPDMPLQGYQGQPNSPLQVMAVAQALAELRNESLAEVMRQTTENACRLFRLTAMYNEH